MCDSYLLCLMAELEHFKLSTEWNLSACEIRDQCSCDTHVVLLSSLNPFLMIVICPTSRSRSISQHLSRQIYELVVVFLSMALCVYLYFYIHFSDAINVRSFLCKKYPDGIIRRGGSIYSILSSVESRCFLARCFDWGLVVKDGACHNCRSSSVHLLT